MALLKANKTIPELFVFLTDEYKIDKKFLFRKVNGVYEGISYKEFKLETENFALGLAALLPAGYDAGMDKLGFTDNAPTPSFVYGQPTNSDSAGGWVKYGQNPV